jgi:hypothetical protein
MLAWKNTDAHRMHRKHRPTWSSRAGLLLVLLAAVLWPREEVLGETGTPFGVRSAYMELVEGVYLLSARLHVPVDDGLREVLKDGVALQLQLEIKVIRQRSYWLDEEVAALTQHYQLRYHAVSDRYIVRNLNGGEQQTFPTLEDALRELTQINRVPVLDRTLISPERDYEGRMRATIEVGEVPAALRWLMFWSDGGRRDSEWYSWRVLQ